MSSTKNCCKINPFKHKWDWQYNLSIFSTLTKDCGLPLTSKYNLMDAQWIPMYQFRFENYDTKKRFQTQNFHKTYHLQVVSSPCPDFQTIRAIFDIFLNFS